MPPARKRLRQTATGTEKMIENVARAAAKLGEVKVSPLKDGKRFVSKNSLAEAMKGTGRNGQPRSGAVAWHLCLCRDRCQLPVPPTVDEMVGGQVWSVFEPRDVPAAIHKLLGAKEAPTYFLDETFAAQLKTLLATCGISEAAASIDAVLGTIDATQVERQRQLQSFSVPTVCGTSEGGSGGGASVALRTCEYNDETLISAIDELGWLGLDGRHAWNDWLKKDIEDRLCSNIWGFNHRREARR